MKFLNLIKEPSADIVKELPIDKKLCELKFLLSCTPENYQKYYLNPINNFISQLNKLPSFINKNQKNDYLNNVLDNIIACLKFRRGYMLPIGADAETCYKEQDTWTYALFTASLIQCSGLLIIRDLFSEIEINELSKYHTIAKSWWACISGDTKNIQHNALVDILTKAKEAQSTINKKEDTDSLQLKLIEELKTAIQNKSLQINQADGFIHHVFEGILLVVPQVVNWFKQGDINNMELHRYYIGRWEDRNIVEGFLLPVEKLFNPEDLPDINSEFHLEPKL